MRLSAYDSDALRLLSAALSDALGILRKSAGGLLTETETSDSSKRLADNLFRAFDSGERNPAALKASCSTKYSLGVKHRSERRNWDRL
jgi:hypothetical protein